MTEPTTPSVVVPTIIGIISGRDDRPGKRAAPDQWARIGTRSFYRGPRPTAAPAPAPTPAPAPAPTPAPAPAPSPPPVTSAPPSLFDETKPPPRRPPSDVDIGRATRAGRLGGRAAIIIAVGKEAWEAYEKWRRDGEAQSKGPPTRPKLRRPTALQKKIEEMRREAAQPQTQIERAITRYCSGCTTDADCELCEARVREFIAEGEPLDALERGGWEQYKRATAAGDVDMGLELPPMPSRARRRAELPKRVANQPKVIIISQPMPQPTPLPAPPPVPAPPPLKLPPWFSTAVQVATAYDLFRTLRRARKSSPISDFPLPTPPTPQPPTPTYPNIPGVPDLTPIRTDLAPSTADEVCSCRPRYPARTKTKSKKGRKRICYYRKVK